MGMARTSAWCPRHGWLVGFVWGLAELTVFFIVPDVGVAFIAAMSPRNWWKSALTSIVGTLVGAVLLFLVIHLWVGAYAPNLLVRIPGIHPNSLALASTQVSDHGASVLLLAAFQGIPYKLYATDLTLAGSARPSSCCGPFRPERCAWCRSRPPQAPADGSCKAP